MATNKIGTFLPYKVGIVGASEGKWNKNVTTPLLVRAVIAKILLIYLFGHKHRLIMVSGRSPKGGVDIWAEEVADVLSVTKEIYPAQVPQWEDVYQWVCKCHREPVVPIPIGKGETTRPMCHETKEMISEQQQEVEILKGYKTRNIQIAEAVDMLYVLSPNCDHQVGLDRCGRCGNTGVVWNGGLWTAQYAERILGKKVVRVVI